MGGELTETRPELSVAIASSDRVYRDSLAQPLRRHGFLVRSFAPAGCADASALDGVDVLILDTDALTPGDLESVRRLREGWPLVEVVAVTGSLPVEDAVEALRAGVFTVLQHPVADELLVTKITQAGGRHRRAKARLDELNHARYGSEEAVESSRTERSEDQLGEAP